MCFISFADDENQSNETDETNEINESNVEADTNQSQLNVNLNTSDKVMDLVSNEKKNFLYCSILKLFFWISYRMKQRKQKPRTQSMWPCMRMTIQMTAWKQWKVQCR